MAIIKEVKSLKPQLTNKHTLFFMALPCFIMVIIFGYLPLAGWLLAFFNYKPGIPLFKSAFVGLKYFKLFLTEPELLPVIRNTLIMSFLGIITSPLPMFFAIFLSEMKSKKYKKFIQTVTTLPNFISWVITYSIFFLFFSVDDGFINRILIETGLISEPTNLLANNNIVWFFQTAVGVWKGLGFGAVVYLAAISGIDQEQYDAASVDGAGRWASITHITLPGLIPTFITLMLLGIGNLLSSGFEQYYVFYNPMVHENIQVLDYYLYRIGITLNDYSFSTALGITKTLISIILLFTANWIAKRLRGQAII